ncbi:MAG: aminotransferase class I/II-fold pyridoxal phosphate-dependent enzyme [Euryarchaeota archaeon]|nr:aminotransferase class I/II-fold pyridoxal phosphate-dependent enzyme [Euryarchaeota archaeon]
MSSLRSFRLSDPHLAERVHLFPESVIREMTRLAMKHGAVNLAQGFPDWDPPSVAIDAAKKAMDSGKNQYAITWGTSELRNAVPKYARLFAGIEADPEKNVTVTCGATEAMMAACLALVDAGDEVIVPEPFYENYGPDAALSGARPRFVPLYPDRGFSFDEEELKSSFNATTKAIILNTPNNPSGKVLTRHELKLIADLCIDNDVVAVTDEIYDFLTYGDTRHVSLASLPGMMERTITIQGASKVYSMTGWRVAWLIAPEIISTALRRVHDFLTVGAPHPLQAGVAAAIETLPRSYYSGLKARYLDQRERLVSMLRGAGFKVTPPEGAYYILSDFADVEAPKAAKTDDRAFAEWLVSDIGLAGVPGSSFFSNPDLGKSLIRFHFAKSLQVLDAAAKRLEKLG